MSQSEGLRSSRPVQDSAADRQVMAVFSQLRAMAARISLPQTICAVAEERYHALHTAKQLPHTRARRRYSYELVAAFLYYGSAH